MSVSGVVSFSVTPSSASSTLSLHDALPICRLPAQQQLGRATVTDHFSAPHDAPLPQDRFAGIRRDYTPDDVARLAGTIRVRHTRSEEHTSELQSRENLVCRLLLEKKK